MPNPLRIETVMGVSDALAMNRHAVDDHEPPPPRPASRCRRRTVLATLAVVALTLVLTACGGRFRRDADSTPSTTAPTTTVAPASTTTVAPAPPMTAADTSDVEQELDQIQSDLDGAQRDLQDG